MIDATETYVLTAAVNISRAEDAICIPLFMKYPENTYFLGNCSNDLRISNFQPFLEFESHVFSLPGDQDSAYLFAVGDMIPLVVLHINQPVILHANTFEELFDKIRDLSSRQNDIFDELSADLSQLNVMISELRANDDAFLASTWIEEEYAPRPAKFWLDETVRSIRILKPDQGQNELEASATRLRLLNWAKEYGENSTSGLFRHFIDLTRVVEQNGVIARDLLAVALIRRISEGIARQQSVANLIGSFRSRYKKSPAAYAVELAGKNDGPFSDRAKEVLEIFYDNTSEAISRNDFTKLLLHAYAVDEEKLWPNEIIVLLKGKISRLSDQLSSLLTSESEKVENLSSIRAALQENSDIYRKRDDPQLERLKELRAEISKSRIRIHELTQMIDIFLKVLDGIDLEKSNIDLATINYERLGLNPSFFDAFDQELSATDEILE